MALGIASRTSDAEPDHAIEYSRGKAREYPEASVKILVYGAGVIGTLCSQNSRKAAIALLSLRAAAACGYPPLWFGA